MQNLKSKICHVTNYEKYITIKNNMIRTLYDVIFLRCKDLNNLETLI